MRRILWSAGILVGCCWDQTTCAFSSTGSFHQQRMKSCSTLRKSLETSIESSSTEPILVHTFWGQERTENEIIAHVTEQLTSIGIIPLVTVLQTEPPLVIIDNLLSEQHCAQIIQSAEDHLQQSTVGAEQEKSTTRTSKTAWIKEHQCEYPLRLMASAVSLFSGLPTSHMKNLQVCRYTLGQEFAIHTDHLDSFNELPVRGRLCTCLLYLQKCEEGGATKFYEYPHLEVKPEQGRAVFFWNTLERPGSVGYKSEMFFNVDLKMRHAGMPVESGEKWICNRWVHPIDIRSGVRGV